MNSPSNHNEGPGPGQRPTPPAAAVGADPHGRTLPTTTITASARESGPGQFAAAAAGVAVSRTQVEAVRYDGDGDPAAAVGTGLGAQDTRPPPAPTPEPHQQPQGAQGQDGKAGKAGRGSDAAGAGAAHGQELRGKRGAPQRRAELLNVIEACFGDKLEDYFDEYLAAIGISVHMGRSVEDTRRLIGRHLSNNGILHVHGENSPPWEVVSSPLGGRGVVATRDLRPGDLVLKDAPLVVGPRAGDDSSCPPVCVGCNQAASQILAKFGEEDPPRDPPRDPLRACPRGCRLPVCAEGACHEAPAHVEECSLLRRWRPSGDPAVWSPELLRASAPVRCLALPPDRREILASMQSNHGRQHAFEVDLLLGLLQERPTADEERFMRLSCCVMDANAFRMTIPCQDGRTGTWLQDVLAAGARPPIGVLRGLYPLGALLNHGCTPNTRHTYDARGHMVVRCVREVRAGEELTVTYSALLWGTPARRQHLLRTKHFLCRCARCQDPTEGGTRLAALPCPARPCRGPVLPCTPLSLGGAWRCSACGLDVPAERATLLQSVLGGMLGSLYPASRPPPSPDDIQRFLQDHEHVLPPTNHIGVELRADVVWGLGHREGFTFPELSVDQLRLKEELCCQLLAVLSALQAGECSLAGMLHYEKYSTLMERVRRDPGVLPDVAKEALEAIETAFRIIGEDNGSPPELVEALNSARRIAGSEQEAASLENRTACRHFLIQFGAGAGAGGCAHDPEPPSAPLYTRS